MERRELLKALATVPFIRPPFAGFEKVPLEKAAAVEVAPHKYWVFYDAQSVDIYEVMNNPWPWPGCEAEFVAVKSHYGKSVQDAVAIYKIGESDAQP